MYSTRTCDPTIIQYELHQFDDAQCRALSHVLGVDLTLDSLHWQQAALPVSLGGLGIRSAKEHAAAAFVASCAHVQELVNDILRIPAYRDKDIALEMLTDACRDGTTPIPPIITKHTPQKTLSRRIDEARQKKLLASELTQGHLAAIKSCGLPGTGAFLSAVPSTALGLRMYGSTFSMALRYRLRLPIFSQEGPCINCGRVSDMQSPLALSLETEYAGTTTCAMSSFSLLKLPCSRA